MGRVEWVVAWGEGMGSSSGVGVGGVFKVGSTFNMHFFSLRNELNDNVARFLRALTAGATVGTSATAASISAGRAIFNTLTTAGRAAHIAGFAASAAMLPLDIYFLVKSSIVLHKGSTSEAVTQIRKILDDLTCPGNDEVPELVDAYVWVKFVEVGNGLVEKPEVSPSPD